jgi:hypothetical protein
MAAMNVSSGARCASVANLVAPALHLQRARGKSRCTLQLPISCTCNATRRGCNRALKGGKRNG